MAKKKAVAKRFPETIYVQWDPNDGSPFLTADETYRSADEGDDVAIYELKRVARKVITHELEYVK